MFFGAPTSSLAAMLELHVEFEHSIQPVPGDVPPSVLFSPSGVGRGGIFVLTVLCHLHGARLHPSWFVSFVLSGAT